MAIYGYLWLSMAMTLASYMFINSLSTIIKTINRPWKKHRTWHITMSRRLLRAWTFQKGIMARRSSHSTNKDVAIMEIYGNILEYS